MKENFVCNLLSLGYTGNMVMSGIYQKRLLKIFVVIALVITFVSSAFFFSFLLSINAKAYNTTLQNLTVARADSMRLSLDMITYVHESILENPNIIKWAEADVKSSEYYYYSVKLYEFLSRLSSGTENLEYNLAITRTEPDSYVITQTGTQSKSDFIGVELSKAVWDFLLHPSAPAFSLIPVYKNNTLNSLLLSTKAEENLLVLTLIPVTSLVRDAKRYSLYINGSYYFPSLDEKDELSSKIASLDTGITGSISNLEVGGDYVHIVTSDLQGLRIYFFYPRYPEQFLEVVLISAGLFLMVLALSLITSYLVVKKLYNPIQDAVSIVGSQELGRKCDEFAILNRNLGALPAMKAQLNFLVKENGLLSEDKYYRELLYSTHPSLECPLQEKDKDAFYSVAEIKLDFLAMEDDEYSDQLQRATLLVKLQEYKEAEQLRYSNISYSRIALIFKNIEETEIKNLLREVMTIDGFSLPLTVGLSSIRRGITSIAECLQEAEKIIEYRHLYSGNVLLTPADVPENDNNNFYYPIFLETRLVSYITSGKVDEALQSFDLIIEQNLGMSMLNKEAHQNLIFSLIGTQLRVMQELKVTSQDLIGRNFDYPWLYANWASDKIVERLRNNLHEVGMAVKRRNELSRSDDFLLEKMRSFIYSNYHDDIMLQDIADYCKITPKYCSTLFKRLSNENFKTFLNEYRIERACDKLEDDPLIRVADLAALVGFNSANSFIRVFKSYKNMTPGSFADAVMGMKGNPLS